MEQPIFGEGRKHSDIFKVVYFEDLQKMYYTLHEVYITKFVDVVDSKMKDYFSETNLKRISTTLWLHSNRIIKAFRCESSFDSDICTAKQEHQ